MQAVFLRKSTVVVNHEEIASIDIKLCGRMFRIWQSMDNREWSFLPPYGFVERNPAVCAMMIDGGPVPRNEEWERMKDAIRPLLPLVPEEEWPE